METEICDINQVDNHDLTPIHYLVQSGYEDLLEIFCEYNPDLNIKSTGGTTPLINAIKQNNLKAFKILLEKGADPNLLDSYNNGAIHYATYIALENKNLEFLKVLLENNANPNLKNGDNYSPMLFAIDKDDIKVFTLLSQYDAIPDLDFKYIPGKLLI